MDKMHRILILEDNASDADLMEFELEEAGMVFTSRRVKAEQEFIQELEAFSPDIILSDYNLPTYSGTQALAETRKRCPDVPFILVTGAISEDLAIDILTGGARDYVMKSRLHRLASAVQRALTEVEEHKARKEAENRLREAHRDLEAMVEERTAQLQAEIQERIRVEKELRQTYELLEAVTKGTEVIISAQDTNFRYIFFNKAYQEELKRLTGKDVQIGMSMVEIFAHMPEQQKVAVGSWSQVLKGRSINTTLEFGDPDRYRRVYKILQAPIRDATGSIVGAGEVAYDVTKVKQMEEALRESEERFRLIASNTPDHVLVQDSQLRYSFVINPQLGLTEKEMIGKTDYDFLSRDDADRLTGTKKQVLETGTPVHLEVPVKSREGDPEYFDGTYIPKFNARGQVDGLIGYFRNVTEQKKREEDLNKLNRTLKALSNSNQAIMRATDEVGYLNDVCGIVVKDCGHAMVWIGYAEDDEDKTVRPVAYAGFDEGYIRKLNVTWVDTERGQGPTGTAIRTGKPAGCSDMINDPLFKPWREEAVKRGYASSMVLPLISGGKTFGAITIYSGKPHAFSDDEVKLLTELADDLSYGISILRLRAAHDKSREALKDSEERFRSLFNSMTEGFALHEIICDDNGTPCDYRFLDVNPAFERITGLKREDVISRTVYEVLPNDDPYWLDSYSKMALTGESVHFQNYSSSLGRHYDVIAYSPKPGQFAVVFMDITKRVEAEEDLRRERDFVSAVLKTEGALVVVLDRQGRIRQFNRACEELTGFSVEEVLGRVFWEFLVPPEDLAGVLNTWEAISAGAFPNTHENYWLTKDGSRRLIAWSNSALTGESGKILHIIGTGIDITERKQAEAELLKRTAELEELTRELAAANKELDSFSYSISHDLRAPLRAIDGYSRMILKKHGDKFDGDTLGKFDVIRNNSHMMGHLIDDLLAFSRLGRKDLAITALDMKSLVRDIWKDLKIINPDRHISLKICKCPTGMGDQTLIRQVLANLLSNAVKFTRGRKRAAIEVGGYKDNGGHVYYVKDNGTGFDMEYYDKLFGVFQRLHSAEEYEGTGVGLAIVQRIIHRHGGKVWAEGKVDEGACFYFTLQSP